MRILQVSSADEYGGGERHVADLARALVERGHELHVAVRPQSPLRRALEDTRTIVWHELPLRGAIDPQSAAGLARVIRENNIDIVHAHVARDYFVSGLAARFTRTPFVLTRHHFNRLKGGLFYPSIVGDSSRLIAVSRSVAATLGAALPSKLSDRIVTIPNWISFNESRKADRAFAREALGIKRSLAIGIAGKITPLKGHMIFLQMAKRLIDETGTLDIDFVVAGESQPRDKRYESELRAFVESAGLGGSVRFVGFVPQIDTLFGAFDIIVAPSEDEAFSLVVAEAMAAECAVVAADRGGMSELIEDGVDGLLVRNLEPGAFADSVRRLIDDPELRATLGAAARQSISSRFSRELVIDRIEAIYRELVTPSQLK